MIFQRASFRLSSVVTEVGSGRSNMCMMHSFCLLTNVRWKRSSSVLLVLQSRPCHCLHWLLQRTAGRNEQPRTRWTRQSPDNATGVCAVQMALIFRIGKHTRISAVCRSVCYHIRALGTCLVH